MTEKAQIPKFYTFYFSSEEKKYQDFESNMFQMDEKKLWNAKNFNELISFGNESFLLFARRSILNDQSFEVKSLQDKKLVCSIYVSWQTLALDLV